MTAQEQRQILQKIVLLIAQIQTSLTEVGISKAQVLTYLSIRIFKTQRNDRSQQKEGVALQKQIGVFLERAKKEGKKVREVLVDLLAALEIEKGEIEEFQNYELEAQPDMILQKRKNSCSSVSQTPPLRTQRSSSIWQRFADNDSSSYRSPKLSPKLGQLMNFERDLNQSLKKTKMLKNIIQQRLMSEMEDTYSSRVRHIHQLLALES